MLILMVVLGISTIANAEILTVPNPQNPNNMTMPNTKKPSGTTQPQPGTNTLKNNDTFNQGNQPLTNDNLNNNTNPGGTTAPNETPSTTY